MGQEIVLRKWPEKTVHLFHHNDADGLSSGAILLKAFQREGFAVQTFCLEKPYPALLKKIYSQTGRILVFADFAGRIAPVLCKLNRERNLTLILDHHVAEASTDPNVHNLDPELFGFKGDRDISASTTCYLFARTLDSVNDDLAHIAGFQILPNEIPGFGPIEFNEVKVSMRVPADLEMKMKSGEMPGLETLLPRATNRLGGFSDACHSLAAATTIPMGKEDQLIAEMEKILCND